MTQTQAAIRLHNMLHNKIALTSWLAAATTRTATEHLMQWLASNQQHFIGMPATSNAGRACMLITHKLSGHDTAYPVRYKGHIHMLIRLMVTHPTCGLHVTQQHCSAVADTGSDWEMCTLIVTLGLFLTSHKRAPDKPKEVMFVT